MLFPISETQPIICNNSTKSRSFAKSNFKNFLKDFLEGIFVYFTFAMAVSNYVYIFQDILFSFAI